MLRRDWRGNRLGGGVYLFTLFLFLALAKKLATALGTSPAHLSTNTPASKKDNDLSILVDSTANPMHKASTLSRSRPQIQRIAVTASTNDVGGFFVVSYMGDISGAIAVEATADEMKRKLEGMSTVNGVNVEVENIDQSTVPPLSSPGRAWLVTFLHSEGDMVTVPLMLVDTGIALPSLVASGGTLSGSAAIISVVRVADMLWEDGLEGVGLAETPSSPKNVVVSILSDSELGVSWKAPIYEGNDNVSLYLVQWDTDPNFGHNRGAMSVEAGQGYKDYSCIISDLNPADLYYVRVLAYNSMGFSDVGDAVLADNSAMQIQELSLLDAHGTSNLLATFSLVWEGKATEELSILSTAKVVEDALNRLLEVGVVSVSREDHSIVVDKTGKGTAPFKLLFRITFIGPASGLGLARFSIDDSKLGSVISTFVNIDGLLGENGEVQPRFMHPSGPENVQLSVVSRTELGVRWNVPLFDGGLKIEKYLVEWDETFNFYSSQVSSPAYVYTNIEHGPVARSAVVTSTSYQIKALDPGTSYHVRVSAYSGAGYSPAVKSSPSWAIPMVMPLHSPTFIELSHSKSETSDRLDLRWSTPTIDSGGFITELDECGTYTGHRTEAASSYLIRWDTNPSMASSQNYNARMVSGDGTPTLCCPEDPCDIEIGAEVQTLSLVPLEGGQITSGSFKVVYVGPQSKPIAVRPSLGSDIIDLLGIFSQPQLEAGDYIRIDNQVYRISSVNLGHSKASLDSEYAGMNTGNEVLAFYNTGPESCFDLSKGESSDDMMQHIALNFDDSPFGEQIVVSRSNAFDSKDGLNYHVTFIGPAFSTHVDDLFVITGVEPSMGAHCGNPFVVDGVPSESLSIEVTTEMDSGSLVPGTSYYVDIAPVNSAGIGPFTPTSPEREIPRSLPGLAQDCRVYAVPHSSSSLKVEWEGVWPYNGQAPTSYKIVVMGEDGNVVMTKVEEQIDESSIYLVMLDSLIPGDVYKILVTAVNDYGEGSPSWYRAVNPTDASLEGRYQDYAQGSCFAVPTCEIKSEGCVENSDSFSIRARSTPLIPEISVATYPSVMGSNRFSKDSLLVTFDTLNDETYTGSNVDMYKVEWSSNSTFDGADFHVTSGTEYMIQHLDMGTRYHVRVAAHNSAGYSIPCASLPATPMSIPDPPNRPTLSVLSLGLYDDIEVGTSLEVDWNIPAVDTKNGRNDQVGDGGDYVSSYLLEWSKVPWNEYSYTVWELNVRDSGGSGTNVRGTFRLAVDTAHQIFDGTAAPCKSALIPVEASPDELETVLENMPCVGDLNVSLLSPMTWRITFSSEVGHVGGFNVDGSAIFDVGGEGVGHVDLSLVTEGNIPFASGYKSQQITDLERRESLKHIIRGLVPGQQYFVRLASRNILGRSAGRVTAPAALAPPVQTPGQVLSLFHNQSPPVLRVHSETALKVDIGPPFYDGGASLTYFLVEWDSSPLFDSQMDGSSLGSARTSAGTTLCLSCVLAFDAESNIFSYSGDNTIQHRLIPQQIISVYFSDDNRSHLFEVVSATTSEIQVKPGHMRSVSMNAMDNPDGRTGSTGLTLLGSEYIIDGLESWKRYFVRVSAENREMGTGSPRSTIPSSEVPHSVPSPPTLPSLRVINKHILNIRWSQAETNGISSYTVECFTKNPNLSQSAPKHQVIRLNSVGLGLVGGWYRLYFGDEPIQRLPGSVKAVPDTVLLSTSKDLTPHLSRGDRIFLDGITYTVHDNNKFTSATVPLLERYNGEPVENASLFTRPKSSRLPYNASALELKTALENIASVGQVHVQREDGISNGYLWIITFLTNFGPQPSFTVNTDALVGTNPDGFRRSTVILEGQFPDRFSAVQVLDPSTRALNLTGLDTGTNYYVQIRSNGDRGSSLPVDTEPLSASPGDVPDSPLPPRIRSLTSHSLLVTYQESARSNGEPVTSYIIETATSSSFDDAIAVRQPVDHRIQRITSNAHTLPSGDESKFILSLGDFHGDYTSSLGSSTLVSIEESGSVAIRASGVENLSAAVPRGDFVRIANMEFRVCLRADDTLPYDNTHLPLCSKDDAWVVVSDERPAVDRAPIFLLDTSLGSVKQPTLGDFFLNTVDYTGSPNDTSQRLKRGDLIRVGDPYDGQTFRVSTNETRTFDSVSVPLATVGDATIDSSLSSKSLMHSNYEVQSILIVTKEANHSLSASHRINSGFRLSFGSETTHTTTSGGARGCLRWNSDAAEMKDELETLAGIDLVDVEKDIVDFVQGVNRAGVKYRVTFKGAEIRGNVPSLRVSDVGENGCLDASDSGGYFSHDIESISVIQESMAFLPVYKVQTTEEIPFDASASDVQSAIKSLSLVCMSDVSRVVEGHGYSWDVTFVGSKHGATKDCGPLLPMHVFNGETKTAYVAPAISVVGLQKVEISDLPDGTSHYVRIAAVNKFGTGDFVTSNPQLVDPSVQTPGPSRAVSVEAISNSEILVQWEPPEVDGGSSITHYRVDYSADLLLSGNRQTAPNGSLVVSSLDRRGISDVQFVTVRMKLAPGDDPFSDLNYLSGTFSLAFDGQRTRQLAYNASPELVEDALSKLCTVIGEVSVERHIHCSEDQWNRCTVPEGYTWRVTFKEVGDKHNRYTSSLGSFGISHQLSVDGSHLRECSDLRRTVCTTSSRNIIANVATVQEVQELKVGSSDFNITIGGYTSDLVSLGDSLEVFKEKLEATPGVGRVHIVCDYCSDGAVETGEAVRVIFLSLRGDVPLMEVSDSGVTVSEIIKGVSQPVVGRSTYWTIVSELSSTHDWFVRVQAFNSIGGGSVANASPNAIRLAARPPLGPRHIDIIRGDDDRSLILFWDRPISNGGPPLENFIIEYDTSPTFSSFSGRPLGQFRVVEDDADSSVADVLIAYPNHPDLALRKRVVLSDADLVAHGMIRVGSELLIGGEKVIVEGIDEDECGIGCLTIDKEYSGTLSNGIKVYLGFDSRQYFREITRLTPGLNYYFRIAAVGISGLTGPFAYKGYPHLQLPLTSSNVPSPPETAQLSTLIDGSLRVDYSQKLKSNSTGSRGDPITGYLVEIAEANGYHPPVLSISTAAYGDYVSGHFEVSLGFEGEYNQLISIPGDGSIAAFSLVAGSRLVATGGTNLTSTLLSGERIMLGDEVVEIDLVSSDGLTLVTPHKKGTGGVTIAGYRMDTFVGLGWVGFGDNEIVEINGLSMEPYLSGQDLIQIVDDLGQLTVLEVDSVAGSRIFLSSTYTASSTLSPIHMRKTVLVPSDCSARRMKQSLELLPGVGSVDVDRLGPRLDHGYTWNLIFTSKTGPFRCFSMKHQCLKSNAVTVRAIQVIGLDGNEYANGIYVLTGFYQGRPGYQQLETGSSIEYNAATSRWTILLFERTIFAEVSSLALYPPLVGWSNGTIVDLVPSYSLLWGTNSEVDVQILEEGVSARFNETVSSHLVSKCLHEVQEINLSADSDDASGYFELSLGKSSHSIKIWTNESSKDFEVKLQSLPDIIGNVHVTRETLSPTEDDKYGYSWIVTFTGNCGDVRSLEHRGLAQLEGYGVAIQIREVVKGRDLDHHIVVPNLEANRSYVARVAAINSVGQGPFTTAVQSLGSGVVPFSRHLAVEPSQPEIYTSAISDRQVRVDFDPPVLSGSSAVDQYKVEWTSTEAFGTKQVVKISLSCNFPSDIVGTFCLVLGNERSVPIRSWPSDDELTLALNSLLAPYASWDVSIKNTSSWEDGLMEWLLTFPDSFGNIDRITLDLSELGSTNPDDRISSNVAVIAEGSLSMGYGYAILSANKSSCGGVYLGGSPSTQYLTFEADKEAFPFLKGSYRLAFDNKETVCIHHNASAAVVQAALLDLDTVEQVDVSTIELHQESQLSPSYSITFRSRYPGGREWPLIEIPTKSFGRGDCTPFESGRNHRVLVLPIQYESRCSSGISRTFAVIAEAKSPLGGTFDFFYKDNFVTILISANSEDFQHAVTSLSPEFEEITVEKRSYKGNMAYGIAWLVKVPHVNFNSENPIICDKRTSGKNSRVGIYPVLSILTSYTNGDGMAGDFRIRLDGETSLPISVIATQGRVLEVIHNLVGIGKAVALGPPTDHAEQGLETKLKALVDDSLATKSSTTKALAIAGDASTTVAVGDILRLGYCNLKITSILFEQFDRGKGAGLLYESKHPSSAEAEKASKRGVTILGVEPAGKFDSLSSFTTNCSVQESPSAEIFVGLLPHELGAKRFKHDIVVISHTADLNAFDVVPLPNWRGSGARMFASGPEGQVPMSVTIDAGKSSSKGKGGKVKIRMSARNSQAYGPSSQIVSSFLGPNLPGPPRSVRLGDYYRSNRLSLTFQPPLLHGGTDITRYLVEWSASKKFKTTFTDEIEVQQEQQAITLSCRSKCHGFFTLSFAGQVSEPISVAAPSQAVEKEASLLVDGDAVRVSRKAKGVGFVWFVTFVGTRGNLGNLEARGHFLSGDDPRVTVDEIVAGNADIYPGSFTSELQTVYVSKLSGFTSPASGVFRLEFEGKISHEISVAATAEDMKWALESLDTVHTVNVMRKEVNGQSGWRITFTHLLDEGGRGAGDIGLLRVSSASLTDPSVTSIKVFENIKGTEPMVYTIGNLTQGQIYFARVVACSQVGYGSLSELSSAIPRSQPRSPHTINASIPSNNEDKGYDGSTVNIVWTKPLGDSGDPLQGYELEYYSDFGTLEVQQITTSSTRGVHEVQVIRSAAESESISGFFSLQFLGETADSIPYNSQADGRNSLESKLKRLSTIGDVSVVRKLSWAQDRNQAFSVLKGSSIVSSNSTSSDLIKYFRIGDLVSIGGEDHVVTAIRNSSLEFDSAFLGPTSTGVYADKWAYGYEWWVTFEGGHVGEQPLLECRPGEQWAGNNPSLQVRRVRRGQPPMSGTWQLGFEGEKTELLPHDASEGEVKSAIEGLKAVGEVQVIRNANGYGHNYLVSFMDGGPKPLMQMHDVYLNGPNAKGKVVRIRHGGVGRTDYGRITLGPEKHQHEISGLKLGKPVYATIKARNAEGYGKGAKLREPIIPRTFPGPPRDISLNSWNSLALKLTWKPPGSNGGSPIESYHVEFDDDKMFGPQHGHLIFPPDTRSCEISVSDLDSTYYVRVRSFNGWKLGSWSEVVTARAAPTVPEAVNFTARMTSSKGIMLQWSPPLSKVTHYRVEVKEREK